MPISKIRLRARGGFLKVDRAEVVLETVNEDTG